MKWYGYLICGVLIIVGVLCSFGLTTLFNKQSAEYGQAVLINKQENYSEISKFDDTLLYDFSSNDKVNFSTKASFDAEDFNGEGKDYILTVNGQPVNNIVLTNGKISGVFVQTFYDTEGQKVATAKVNMLVEYLKSETRVSLSIKNENESVAYLNAYIEINGFVIRVVERRN